MKYLAILVAVLVISGCDAHGRSERPDYTLTYEQLKTFPTSCEKATEQQDLLKAILKMRNFDVDPDNLDEDDRAYNSKLKATIWWYEYRCRSPQ